MGLQYWSDALAAVHETALGLHEAGVVDKRTMKEFDGLCLTPVAELSAEEIREIRLHERRAKPSSRVTSTSRRTSSANGSAARSARAAPRSSS
jgi:DNA-binding transcriptional regulator YiaG